jgi:hypothetical protein
MCAIVDDSKIRNTTHPESKRKAHTPVVDKDTHAGGIAGTGTH